jgi:hypothetical protein
MPRLEESIGSLPTARVATSLAHIGLQRNAVDSEAMEEELVVDDRSSISPAQLVEDKLTRILKDSSLPVSHLQMRGLLRSR